MIFEGTDYDVGTSIGHYAGFLKWLGNRFASFWEGECLVWLNLIWVRFDFPTTSLDCPTRSCLSTTKLHLLGQRRLGTPTQKSDSGKVVSTRKLRVDYGSFYYDAVDGLGFYSHHASQPDTALFESANQFQVLFDSRYSRVPTELHLKLLKTFEMLMSAKIGNYCSHHSALFYSTIDGLVHDYCMFEKKFRPKADSIGFENVSLPRRHRHFGRRRRRCLLICII